ncbi:error-prone DNA polymerase [Novosphingobium mangrovi (ex Huang et al. 2023)]|uniref:Error-prone DNA polymerase n=1 Tax=Novosphingobium mangrovi (ex Huang et al. 2023) TaxID=2976432 RepID=A0ABT2I2J9_9SPHN|nr:error-prone DNA polymerase [Novosphingobium mangrovi (ex Huang et al. 2023)]MCT2399018.1 error-prone DNA polymerase [Novosphingobium mangrovi (ex Huang et al. 2023)]
MTVIEPVVASAYSFLRGASHPGEMVARAHALGMAGIGIADRNTVAGVVRAHVAWKQPGVRESGFRLLTGARLVFADGTPDVAAYPMDRAGWGRLTRLLTLGNRRAEKGDCLLHLPDLLDHAEGLALIAMDGTPELLGTLKEAAPHHWLAATMPRGGRDARELARRIALSGQTGVPLIATNDALYAAPECRPLHDVMTCIREGTNVQAAGRKLAVNAERHLKPPAEMARLFARCPEALTAGADLLSAIRFTLDDLRYEYPHEPVPPGHTPQGWLEHLAGEGARTRFPKGVPEQYRQTLAEEFRLIRERRYAPYFLTVHDIVAHARSLDPPILCQGRGSAANSLVCYFLGITPIDPVKEQLLFSRFLSEARDEPPDIDVDFEHERREEVIQYIYERYGRERAGIAATVIHYRQRSAIREVGKALGMTDDVTASLSGTIWGSYGGGELPEARLAEAGLGAANPELARLRDLVGSLLEFPRHLSQHVGGFVLTEGRLDELVPIHNAAMPDRTFIEWDKDDIDALHLMKVDVLALGMLTCIRKSFDLMREHGLGDLVLATVPREDAATYRMLQKADSMGTFQVESRAQMSMLPRLRPKTLYDLVIQVAIVRPGPIQGGMVHPYLRRRNGEEVIELPGPPGSEDELRAVLGKTLGVPLFQEQAMKLAIVAAGFTPAEADGLRRAMATFRRNGTMHFYQDKLVEGMVRRGYRRDFAERCFEQIKGFGDYGFPESHAQAFAWLAYVSSWLKCHYPAVFTCALLNSQPMGFYAPSQLVQDARAHGVEVRPIDAAASQWDSTLEGERVLRLGLRQIGGFREDWAQALHKARGLRAFTDIQDLASCTGLPARAMALLADADALGSLGQGRRQAGWDVRRLPPKQLSLFAAMEAPELGAEPDAALPVMPLSEEVAADYQTHRLSLKGHPMQFLRAGLAAEGVLSCADVNAAKDGARVRCAGVVLVRQRPGKGNAVFITIEDETGVVNALLWARDFEQQRRPVMAARLAEIAGEIQRSKEGVVHLMAKRVTDRSALLARLDGTLPADLKHERSPAAPRSRHPRNVRILPRSRDFH